MTRDRLFGVLININFVFTDLKLVFQRRYWPKHKQKQADAFKKATHRLDSKVVKK